MSDEAPDPLMVALCHKLPKPGSVWPISDRMLWLAACEAAINFIYGPTSDSVVLPAFLKEESVCEPEPPEQESGTEAVAYVPPFRKTFSRTGTTSAALSPRPEGIPTTFCMIQDVLDKTPGLKAHELVAVMTARWWPGLEFKRVAPDISTWIKKGRIARDGDGKLTLTAQGRRVKSLDLRKIASEPPPPPDVEAMVAPVMSEMKSGTIVIEPKASSPPQRQSDYVATAARFAKMRAEKAAAPPKSTPPSPPKPVATPAAATHQFGYGDGTVLLSLREHRILSKLKSAMGKGMLEGRMLVDAAFAGEAAKINNSESYLYELMRGLNPRLDILGIEMVGVPTMPGSARIAGYVLRAK